MLGVVGQRRRPALSDLRSFAQGLAQAIAVYRDTMQVNYSTKLATAAQILRFVQSSIQGGTHLITAGRLTARAQVSLLSLTQAMAAGQRYRPGAAASSSLATVSTAALGLYRTGSAIADTSTLTGFGHRLRSALASIADTSSVVPNGQRVGRGQISALSSAVTLADGQRRRPGAASIQDLSQIAAQTLRVARTEVQVQALSELMAVTKRLQRAAAALASSTTITTTPTGYRPATMQPVQATSATVALARRTAIGLTSVLDGSTVFAHGQRRRSVTGYLSSMTILLAQDLIVARCNSAIAATTSTQTVGQRYRYGDVHPTSLSALLTTARVLARAYKPAQASSTLL